MQGRMYIFMACSFGSLRMFQFAISPGQRERKVSPTVVFGLAVALFSSSRTEPCRNSLTNPSLLRVKFWHRIQILVAVVIFRVGQLKLWQQILKSIKGNSVVASNRVRAGIYPALPTSPCMRDRTGQFI